MTAATLCCPLPAESDDPGFRNALDSARLRELIETKASVGAVVRELTPDYVRWKEQDGSIVGWRAVVVHEGREHLTYVTVRTADSPRLLDEAAKLAHRSDEAHAGLRAWTLLPDQELLLLTFPLDRNMPDLRRLVRASKVRSLLEARFPEQLPGGLHISKSRSRCEVKRYKPERRAVLFWNLALVDAEDRTCAGLKIWVRLYASATAQRCATASRAAAVAGIGAPEPLAILHDRLLIESHIEGRPWTIGEDHADAAAAHTLARLHGAHPPAALPAGGVIEELDLVLRAVDDLARLDADMGAFAAAIADELARTVPAPGTLVFCHGDFHPGQVLTDAGVAGLCDFDRSCLAPPARDLAALYAHCVVVDPKEGAARTHPFWQHYDRCSGLPPESELAWWNSCALLRAAMAPFRAMQADWPDRTRELLSAAESEAQAGRKRVIR